VKTRSAALSLVRQLVRSAEWRLALTIGLMLAFSVTEGFGILLLLPTLQAAGLNLSGQGSADRYAQLIEHGFRSVGLTPTLGLLLILFVALVAIRTILAQLQGVAIVAVEQRFMLDLRLRLYRAITNADWLFICRNRGSEFTHALTAELARVEQASYRLLRIAGDAALTSLYCAIALRLSAAMTLLVIGCGVLLVLSLHGRSRKIELAGNEQSDNMNGLFAVVIESLQNLKTIKAWGTEKRDQAFFADSSRALAAANLMAAKAETSATAWFELGSAVITGAVLYSAIRILAVPPATILILLVLFARVMPRLMSAHQGWRLFVGLLPSFSKLLAMEERCVSAAEPPVPSGRGPELRRNIQFEDVSFSYTRDGRWAVRRVDLAVPAGSIFAIVGASGAGKSTILDLAMGLLNPTEGTISIDGVRLSKEATRRWRGQVGYVAPDTFLLHDSIRANLTRYCPGASEAEIREALTLAAADTFVDGLPHGLDTVIGDRGVTLSHGERQRIALARAILRRPQLLVLDEATNNIDSMSEARIMAALEKRRDQSTVLLVAHRIASVMHADLIYVFEDGRVVEFGDWNELSALPAGRFRAMCKAQELAA
jgi:ATP-binding cassette subfamily C protein